MGLRIKSASLHTLSLSLSLFLSVFLSARSLSTAFASLFLFPPASARSRVKKLSLFVLRLRVSLRACVSKKGNRCGTRAPAPPRTVLSSFSPSRPVSLVRSPAPNDANLLRDREADPRALKDAAHHPRQTRAPQCHSADFDNAWQVASSLPSLQLAFFSLALLPPRVPLQSSCVLLVHSKMIVFLPPPLPPPPFLLHACKYLSRVLNSA